jgi:hypothetical protein
MKNAKYNYGQQNRKPKMIVRLTKTEYEMDDGTIYPIPFEIDKLPTIEEFQTIYDEWFGLFKQKKLIVNEDNDE